MLQGLAKAKALKELQALVNSKASLNGLALAKALKRQNELRLDLGMGKSTPAKPNVSTNDGNSENQDGHNHTIEQALQEIRSKVLHASKKDMPMAVQYAINRLAKHLKNHQDLKPISDEIGFELMVNKSHNDFVKAVDKYWLKHKDQRVKENKELKKRKAEYKQQQIESGVLSLMEEAERLSAEWVKQIKQEYADTLLFNKSGQILLAQRSVQDDFKPNKWWIIGGKIEQGETPEQGAIRELAEETGVKLFDLKFLEKVNLPTGGISHRFAEVVKDDTPIYLKKDELQAYRWVSVDELSKFDLLGKLSDLKNLVELAREIVGFDGWSGNDQAVKADLSILQVSDDPVQVVNYVYKQAQKQYSGKKPKEITVKSDGSVILLGWQGIKHALSDKGNQVKALATTVIETLVENAEFLMILDDKHNGSKPDIKQTLLYTSNLDIGNQVKEIGVVVRELKDKKKLYDYFTDIKTPLVPLVARYPAISGDMNNITKEESAVNSQDENIQSKDGWDGNDKIPQNSQPFNRTNIKIPKSIKARQNANNQAMAILDRLDGGELSVDDLTDDDKAVLAKYSGNGGGLIGRDGKKGSDYEYYTPHELASGMWDLAKELGFDGGRVLDPCAGTGVFTATSPDNVLMDNIELDETSGRINQILNDGVRAKTTISPFEKVVNGYDDGDDETGFDLVMSNVPFGNNAARGANKMYDKAYQDASLDYYFILRSLEKLKSGGLAVLMTAPSTVQGKRAREIELRQKTSRIAEFIGAYRLPNSMFTDTGADVSVDVMVFKKFNQSMIETVQNHYDNGNIELLQQANVLWDDYLSGHYFKKHPKNVLGTVQKTKNRFGDDIEVVQSELSKSQIAKLMVKLGGSRIDWELLNATQAKPITYQNGDVVYRAGVQYQYQHGTWQEMVQVVSNDDIRHNETLAKLQDSHNAMNVSYDDIKTALAYFAKKGVVNEQINDAKVLLSHIKDGVEWRIYHTSKAIDSVLANSEIGANLKEIYPGLSDEMRDVVVLAKGRYQGVISNALKNIKLHYNNGDYSDVWNGNIQTQHDTLEVTGTLSAKIAKLQYNNKSKYLSIDDFKAIAPDVDLMTDDDYFITKDGKQVVLASDFLVGNCKERLDELQNWIDECDDEALKTKLSRQYVMASLQIPNVDIYKASFDLLSPQIPMSFKMDFLNSVMPIKVALDGKGLKMMGSAKSNSEKIANRILYNINGNRLTLGGIELTDKGEKMNEKQALKLLNETFLQYNAQFKSWVKANDTLIDLLDSKINSLDNCYFSQNDDDGELEIHGFNVKLHGYQNAFVRQQGRSFGGLNGFGVGLGKTFTSLASVQHTQNIGAKNKTIFVVPKSVLSNWRKEAMKAYASLDDCLFVGLREVRDKMVAKSSEYDADLQKALSREYRKIFMTQEAFQRIKLQDDTLEQYFTHLAQNDDIYNAQESE